MNASGCVFLVGAGPGDPELLTLRASRLLREADVVVYDRLVAPEILELARPDAERIYVGKEPNGHLLPQAGINDLLVRLACEGKRIVRLKGGDPFVFGRGGEEAEALAERGVPFEVVPGVTAACGVAARAGIPLTHRDLAHACVLVAGHLKDGSIDVDWEALARPRQTLAIYMGLAALPVVCRELVAHGLTPETPAAAIQQGTTPGERVVVGNLADLPQRVAAAGLEAPALIIVGEVVRLRAVLAQTGAAREQALALAG